MPIQIFRLVIFMVAHMLTLDSGIKPLASKVNYILGLACCGLDSKSALYNVLYVVVIKSTNKFVYKSVKPSIRRYRIRTVPAYTTAR